ncbi:amino acid permease [Flavobacterium sp. JP2137]|uniref:amino acid permease n=1 Tax=Flavobacterium sp. JP2137 TaxID=3414510 RepID=UPI003D2FF738
MEYLYFLLFGFIAAVIGVSLPGLLNMTAVKIALKEGKESAYSYVLGALFTIFIQTYIAIFFAKLIESSVVISETLQEIGVAIFGALTLYFLFFAKKKEKKEAQGELVDGNSLAIKNRFFYGILLAALNVFPIPYYVFLSITLASYDFPVFYMAHTFLLSIGVVLGSALMLYLYIAFFKNSDREEHFLLKNINYCIGTITGIIALITLYKLLK